jgi:hypothetical protein
MNTKMKVDDEIIKFFTNLQFEKNISIITIEKFMEKYLQKCYIPEEDIDLNYLNDIKPFTSFQYFQKRFIDCSSRFIRTPSQKYSDSLKVEIF